MIKGPVTFACESPRSSCRWLWGEGDAGAGHPPQVPEAQAAEGQS